MRYFFFFLVFGWMPSLAQNISVFVKDVESGEVVSFASISWLKYSSVTNAYGFIAIPAINTDSCSFKVSSVGFQVLDTVIYIKGLESLELGLVRKRNLLSTVKVNVNSSLQQVGANQTGLLKIPIATLKKMPSLLGSQDVFKALQYLPGINFGMEGTSNLYIRGGSPDQNLVLLDDMPIYNVNHLFGFISVFNSDLLKDISVYKSGIPAKYGGRISSVIDIRSLESNYLKKKMIVDVNVINTSLVYDTYLKKGKSNLVVGLRTANFGQIMGAFNRLSGAPSGYNLGFSDLAIKHSVKVTSKDQIFFSTYVGFDKFSTFHRQKSKDTLMNNIVSSNTSGLEWGNKSMNIRWLHISKKKSFNNLSFSFTNYKYAAKSSDKLRNEITNENAQFNIIYESRINDYNLKYEVSKNVKNISFDYGIQSSIKSFVPGISYTTSDSVKKEVRPSQISNAEVAAYLEIDKKLGKHSIKLGNRLVNFSSDNLSKFFYEPRLSYHFKFTNTASLSSSFGINNQNLHLITNSGAGLPTDLWIPASKDFLPQRSQQFAVAFKKWFTKTKLLLTVEAYNKEMSNLIEYKDGISFLNADTNYINTLVSGNGNAKGLEFLLEKNSGRFSGWIDYTLSDNNRTFSALNNGATFPYRYNRRHMADIVANYEVKENKVFSIAWKFASGTYFTLPDSKYYVQSLVENGMSINPLNPSYGYFYSNFISNSSARNNYQTKPYHRLDISYKKTKVRKKYERTISYSINNLYARPNTFYIYAEQERINNQFKMNFFEYTLITFIPSVGCKWVFNNL